MPDDSLDAIGIVSPLSTAAAPGRMGLEILLGGGESSDVVESGGDDILSNLSNSAGLLLLGLPERDLLIPVVTT